MWILCNNYEKTLVYLKPPDSLQRPRVSRYGMKTLLCILLVFSDVLHDRVSEIILMATPYALYHKLTKVARNYCSHYDNASENCGPLLWKTMLESTRQIKEKLLFYIRLLRLSQLIL